MLMLGGHSTDQPIMLTEFGGIAFSPDTNRTWGYTRVSNAEEFAQQYSKLLATVNSLSLLAGFCYTQFADTCKEANGLLYADRTPKLPLNEIQEAPRGVQTRFEPTEYEWRERIMESNRAQYFVPPEDYRTQDDR